MKGVWNKVLKVDLTAGISTIEHVPDQVYEDFLGGAGLAAYYLWKECPARCRHWHSLISSRHSQPQSESVQRFG